MNILIASFEFIILRLFQICLELFGHINSILQMPKQTGLKSKEIQRRPQRLKQQDGINERNNPWHEILMMIFTVIQQFHSNDKEANEGCNKQEEEEKQIDHRVSTTFL